jgi:hypothetical protein
LEDLGADGRIALKWILDKSGLRAWMDSTGQKQGPVVDSCEYGNEASGSINGTEFAE